MSAPAAFSRAPFSLPGEHDDQTLTTEDQLLLTLQETSAILKLGDVIFTFDNFYIATDEIADIFRSVHVFDVSDELTIFIYETPFAFTMMNKQLRINSRITDELFIKGNVINELNINGNINNEIFVAGNVIENYNIRGHINNMLRIRGDVRVAQIEQDLEMWAGEGVNIIIRGVSTGDYDDASWRVLADRTSTTPIIEKKLGAGLIDDGNQIIVQLSYNDTFELGGGRYFHELRTWLGSAPNTASTGRLKINPSSFIVGTYGKNG